MPCFRIRRSKTDVRNAFLPFLRSQHPCCRFPLPSAEPAGPGLRLPVRSCAGTDCPARSAGHRPGRTHRPATGPACALGQPYRRLQPGSACQRGWCFCRADAGARRLRPGGRRHAHRGPDLQQHAGQRRPVLQQPWLCGRELRGRGRRRHGAGRGRRHHGLSRGQLGLRAHRRAARPGLADVWQRHHGRHGQRHPQAAQPHQLGRGAAGRGHGRHAAPGPGRDRRPGRLCQLPHRQLHRAQRGRARPGPVAQRQVHEHAALGAHERPADRPDCRPQRAKAQPLLGHAGPGRQGGGVPARPQLQRRRQRAALCRRAPARQGAMEGQ